MTFAEFQAARVWSDDLRASLPDVFNDEASSPPQSGWIYAGSLYIEEVQDFWPDKARARGRWYLVLGNWDKISDDLAELERELYDYAVGEDVINPPADAELIKREFPDYDVTTLPAMPDGFECTAWHNDAMPVWFEGSSNDKLSPGVMQISADFPNEADREYQGEYPGIKRFAVQMHTHDGQWEFVLETDEGNEIVPVVAYVRYVRRLGLGFHVDTRGRSYVDGNGARVFTDDEADEYDRVVDAVHGFADPYELAIKIWKIMGLVD